MEQHISAEMLLTYIRAQRTDFPKYEEICAGLHIEPEEQGEVSQLLGKLEKQGDLVRTHRGKYGLPEHMDLYRGVLRISSRGTGLLLPDTDSSEEILIPKPGLHGAMHEDVVLVYKKSVGYGRRRAEGEVVRILQHGTRQLTGILQREKEGEQVLPDDPRQIYPVRVRAGKARNGDKVLVKITAWPDKNHLPQGEITEIFGKSGRPESDLRKVIYQHELREDFPEEVLVQARQAAYEGIGNPATRRDLRDALLITIDGADAKDLDDAVSLLRLPEGWRLGVHIADVSHYVHPHTPLDREAYARGTSVYLLNTVLPMLPPDLCNGICSLNPQEERLAISCVMDLDESGELLHYELFHSVICTAERMTYSDVEKLLQGNHPALATRYARIVPMLEDMRLLAGKLREKRHRRGALEFNFPEADIQTDKDGNPVNITIKERSEAEKIIEDFMIQANEVVAAYLYHKKAPVLYRVHEAPDAEGIQHLKDICKLLGCRMPQKTQSPREWQQLLEQIQDEPYAATVSMMILRSLHHANYRPEELGHFGLAAEYYCHFTSPIRRYPDLLVHRILSCFLRNDWSEIHHPERDLKEWGEHCSAQERRAEEAERALMDCKKARYMQNFIGEIFSAQIVGIQSFGFFVQLKNTVEGLVHISSLADDYYEYEERTCTLRGIRTHKIFRIGDEVEVLLLRANADEAQIDFALYCTDEEKSQTPETENQERKKKHHEQQRKGRKEEQKKRQGEKRSQRKHHGKDRRKKDLPKSRQETSQAGKKEEME